MLDLARGYFRRSVFKTYRYFKHPRRLKQSAFLRWFSRHFLDKTVWRPTQHTLAGGLAVGLFVMMQLVPGQMLFAVVVAALLRVNIPMAVLGSWITNPFTMPFAAVFQLIFGKWILDFFGYPTPHLPPWSELHSVLASFHATSEEDWKGLGQVLGLQSGKDWWILVRTIYSGGIVAGIAFAIAGYALSYFSWGLVARIARWRRAAKKISSSADSSA